MSKWLQLTILFLVGLISLNLVSAGTSFDLASCNVLNASGTSIDANCDGIIDNAASLNGFSSAYFTPLALHSADNSSTWSYIGGLNTKINMLVANNVTVQSNIVSLNASINSLLVNNVSFGNSIANLIQSNTTQQSSINNLIASNTSLWSNFANYYTVVNGNSLVTNLSNLNTSTQSNITALWNNFVNYYTTIQVDALINNISNLSNYYTKAQIDAFNSGLNNSIIANTNSINNLKNDNTTLQNSIVVLNVTKLNISDQRYNDTALISSEANARTVNDSILQGQINNLSLNGSYNLAAINLVNASLQTLFPSNVSNTNSITNLKNDNTTLQNKVNSLNTSVAFNISTLYASNLTQSNDIANLKNDNTTLQNFKTAISESNLTKLVDVTSANSYIGVSGSTNKSLTFSESVLNNTITNALATTYFNVTSLLVITGTSSGILANINSYNSIPYNVTEVSSAFELRLNFTNVSTFNQLLIRYRTIVAEVHNPEVTIWNYEDSTWESYAVLSSSDGVYVWDVISVFDPSEHLNNSIVQVRIYVAASVPSKTDLWNFDWITLSKGVASQVGTETDPLSVHKDGATPLTGNWNTGAFNITTSYIIADGSALTNMDKYNQTTLVNNVNTSLNIQNLGFNTTAQLDTWYGELRTNNEWTGFNKFNPTTNTSFFGDVLYYGNAYYSGTVVFTNSSVMNVGMSGITLKNIANITVGRWNDTNSKGNFWTDGTINSTGFMYEEGTRLALKYYGFNNGNSLATNITALVNSNTTNTNSIANLIQSNTTLTNSINNLKNDNTTLQNFKSAMSQSNITLNTLFASNTTNTNSIANLIQSNTTTQTYINSINTSKVNITGGSMQGNLVFGNMTLNITSGCINFVTGGSICQ